MATTLTWIGGHEHNKASDPSNWSPSAVPLPGDDLVMMQGVMNVSDDDLAGDILSVTGDVDINTRGTAALNIVSKLAVPFHLKNINMDVNGKVDLSALVSGANLTTHGGTIRFIGSNTFDAESYAVLNSDLTGSTTVNLTGGTAAASSTEINGSVDDGITFRESGFAVTLKIDRPLQFHGTVDGIARPLDLVGLANVDSWSYSNDLLSMYNNRGKVVDTLHVISHSASGGLLLSKTAAGDILVSQGSDFHGSLALPTA